MDNIFEPLQEKKINEPLFKDTTKDFKEFEYDLFAREDYDQVKLDHAEGYYKKESGEMEFSLAKYDSKIEKFQTLTKVGNEKLLEDYSKKHKNKSSKRRADHAKLAIGLYSAARDKADSLHSQKLALEAFDKENPSLDQKELKDQRKRMQRKLYNTEDQLLDERYEATKESIKTDAVSKRDQKIRLAKAELAYYAAKLKAIKNRGDEFTNAYTDLYAKYTLKAKEINTTLFRSETAHTVRKEDQELKANLFNMLKKSGDDKVFELAKLYSKPDANIDGDIKNELKLLTTEAHNVMDKKSIIAAISQIFIDEFNVIQGMQQLKKTLDSIKVNKSENEESEDNEEIVANRQSEYERLQKSDNEKDKALLKRYDELYRKAIDYDTKTKINFTPGNNLSFKSSQGDNFRRFQHRAGSMNCPMQGWKLHIAINNWKDYYEMCSVLVPEFLEKNIIFKIVDPGHVLSREKKAKVNKDTNTIPSWSDHLIDNTSGKEFTIYPDRNFNYDELSDKAKAVLEKNTGSKNHIDKAFEGNRFTTRYGVYAEAKLVNAKQGGKLVLDDRKNKNARPDFVEDLDEKNGFKHVCDIHRKIEDEFQKLKEEKRESGGADISDYKLYINRYMTGIMLEDSKKLPLQVTEVLVPSEWHKSYEEFKKKAEIKSDHTDNYTQPICHLLEFEDKTFLVHTESSKKIKSRLSSYSKYLGQGTEIPKP